MMRSAIILVTALVTVSSAIPWGSRAKQQCTNYCKETNKYDYDVGKVYIFDYLGETISKINGTSDEESRLHLRTLAEFEVVSKCEFILRISRVRLEESDPSDKRIRTQSEGLDSFAAALEKYPLMFAIQDGEVEHLCPSADEELWSLNVKRGIISALQNSMHNMQVPQKVYETDVSGHCETTYNVLAKGRNGVKVSRSKNLLSCTGRNSHQLGIQASPYSSSSSTQSLPLLKSETRCEQTIRDRRLERTVCEETHFFQPFSNENSGAVTTVSQTLAFREERLARETLDDFKKTKASLLFENEDQIKASEASESLVLEALDLLSKEIDNGVTQKTPELFAELVSGLRPLSYLQLSTIFSITSSNSQRKLLVDAAPLLGTAASYAWMRDMIKQGLLSDIETDMWVASLAFQTKPTLEMIIAVTPLLSGPDVRPKAILSISAMIYAYCQSHSECEAEEAIINIVGIIEKRITCRAANAQEEESSLLALKALGNAGVIVSSAETLKKCYEEENAMAIRLAAIEAHRRVPCYSTTRKSLWALFRNANYDSELRIAAYLAVMQCPTPQLIKEIKYMLTEEAVNQVGSFVWTHLTNLQETSSRSKQDFRRMLSSDFLRNKFNTDVRKFSRNFEASTFSEQLNVGASVESNVIFSSRSYLPRSGMVNLTLDLFGQSVNLLELGARIEGFESLVESFFGPNGVFPDETIEKVLQSARGKREINEASLNELATTFDLNNHLSTDQPQGGLYMRIFGNELHAQSFKASDMSSMNNKESPLDMLLRAIQQKEIDFTKSLSFLNARYTVPTLLGFPLALTVNGTATVQLKMSGQIVAPTFSSIDIMGHFKPRGTVQINGVMSVSVGDFVRSGIQIKNTMHTSTGISGKVSVRGTDIVSVHIDAPEETTNLFSYDSDIFFIYRNQKQAIKPDHQKQISRKSCSPLSMNEYLGLVLCGELDYHPVSEGGARGPLTGPTHAAIVLQKTDTHSAYKFDYEWKKELMRKKYVLQTISLTIDTPNSKTDRKLSAQIMLDEAAKSVRTSFTSPLKNAEFIGKYDYNDLLKGADVLIIVDGEEMGSIRAALRSDIKGPSGRYEPSLVITKRNKDILHFQGYFNYQHESKFGYDFQLRRLTTRPIRFTGDLSRTNGKTEVNVALKSYFLDTSLMSTYRSTDNVFAAKVKVNYSIMESQPQNLEVSTKYNQISKGLLDKVSIAGVIQGTQFPLFNTDFSWDFQKSANFLENSIRLVMGYTQWNIKQSFSDQYRNGNRDWKAGASVVCLEQNIDFMVQGEHRSNETSFYGRTAVRLSPGREWTAMVDVTHQLDPLNYGGRIELSTPTAIRQISASVVESPDQNQWDVNFEYAVDKLSDTSVAFSYKNLNDDTKVEFGTTLKVRSSLAQDIDLASSFLISSISTKLSVMGRHGINDISGHIEYQDNSHEGKHKLLIRASKNQEIIFLTSIDTDVDFRRGFYSLAVNIIADRRITFDASFQPDPSSVSTQIELFWDRDRDPSRVFKFSGQFSGSRGNAILQYPGQLLKMRLEMGGENIIALVEWDENQRIRIDFALKFYNRVSEVKTVISTSFEGYEWIYVDINHEPGDFQVKMNCGRDSIAVSTKGKYSQDLAETSVKFTSTYPNWESMSFNLTSESTPNRRVFLFGVEHKDRIASIKTHFLKSDLAVDEFESTKGAIELVTPIEGYGYSSIEFSTTQDHDHDSFGGTLEINMKPKRDEEDDQLNEAYFHFWSKFNRSIDVNRPSLMFEAKSPAFIDAHFNFNSVAIPSYTGLTTSWKLVTPWTENFSGRILCSDRNVRRKKSDVFFTIAEDDSDNSEFDEEEFPNDPTSSTNLYGHVRLLSLISSLSLNDVSYAVRAELGTPLPGFDDSIVLFSTMGKLDVNGTGIAVAIEHAFDSASEQDHNTVTSKMKINVKKEEHNEIDFSLSHSNRYVPNPSEAKYEYATKSNINLIVGNQEYSWNTKNDYRDIFNWQHQGHITSPLEYFSKLVTTASCANEEGSSYVKTKFELEELLLSLELDTQTENNGRIVTSYSSEYSSRGFERKLHAELAQNFSEIKGDFVLSIYEDGQALINIQTEYDKREPFLKLKIESPYSKPIDLKAMYHFSDHDTFSANAELEHDGFFFNFGARMDIKSGVSHWEAKLSSSLEELGELEFILEYDVLSESKSINSMLDWDGKLFYFNASANSPEGMILDSEISIKSPWKSFAVITGHAKLTYDRIDVKLDTEDDGIRLLAEKNVEDDTILVKASLNIPVPDWESVEMEASYNQKPNEELEIDKLMELKISFKNVTTISAEGSYRIEADKASVKGSLKTPFENLQSSLFEASYDGSSGKKALIFLQRDDRIFRVDAEAKLELESGMILLAVVDSEVERHVNITASYDTASAGVSNASLAVNVNGIKHQIEVQLVNNDQNGELMMTFNTAAEERIKLDAKYDNRESVKTAVISLKKSDRYYHVAYEAKIIDDSFDILVKASDSMNFKMDVKGRFDNSQRTKLAEVIFNYNNDTLEWGATGDLSPLKSLIQFTVNSTIDFLPENYRSLNGEFQYDLESPVKKSIIAKLEQPGNNELGTIIDASIGNSEASLKLQSFLIGFENISADAIWKFNLQDPRIELGVSRNNFNAKIIANGTLSAWNSSFAFKAHQSEGDVQQSVSFTSEYDLNDALYAVTEFVSINAEGISQKSSLLINIDDNSVLIETTNPYSIDYHSLSLKMSFDFTNTPRTVNITLTKNEQYIEINGVVRDDGIEADYSGSIYSDIGLKTSAKFQYNNNPTSTRINTKLTIDDEVYEANGSIISDGDLIAKAQINMPFNSYQIYQMGASLSTKSSNNSLRVAFNLNDYKFEINGSLDDDYRGFYLRVQTPFNGYDYISLSGKLTDSGVTAGLSVPSSNLNGTFTSQYSDDSFDVDAILSTESFTDNLGFHLNVTDLSSDGTFQISTDVCDITSGKFNINTQNGIYAFNLVDDKCGYRGGNYEATVKIVDGSFDAAVKLQSTYFYSFYEVILESSKTENNFYITNEIDKVPIFNFNVSTGFSNSSTDSLLVNLKVPILTNEDLEIYYVYDTYEEDSHENDTRKIDMEKKIKRNAEPSEDEYDYADADYDGNNLYVLEDDENKGGERVNEKDEQEYNEDDAAKNTTSSAKTSAELKIRFGSKKIEMKGQFDEKQSAEASLSTSFSALSNLNMKYDFEGFDREDDHSTAIFSFSHFDQVFESVLDIHNIREGETNITFTLAAPLFGWENQMFKTCWRLTEQEEVFNFGVAYNTMSADFAIDYGDSFTDPMELLLTLKSDIPGWEEMSIEGRYEHSNGTQFLLESKARWAKQENVKFNLACYFHTVQPSINMTLSSSLFETSKLSGSLKLDKNFKADLVFSHGRSNYRFNVAVVAPQLTQWSAHFIFTIPNDKHALHLKFELESIKKAILLHLDSRLLPIKIQGTATSRNGRQLLTSLISIPAAGITEWRLNADSAKGKSRATIFWGPRQSISLNLSHSRLELSFKLRTPFSFLKSFDINCKSNPSKTEFNAVVSYNSDKITLDVSLPSETSISLMVKTPFPGYRKTSLHASYNLEPNYTVYLIYKQDRQQFEIDGKLSILERNAKFSFDVSLNNKKFTLTSNIYQENESVGGIVTITTPFLKNNMMSLNSFISWDENYIAKVIYEHDSKKLFELQSEFIDSDYVGLNLQINTPFPGFRNIGLNVSEHIRPDYLVTFTYVQEDYKLHFQAEYRDKNPNSNSSRQNPRGYQEETEYGYYDDDQNEYNGDTVDNTTQEVLKIVLEGSISDQKIATEISMTTRTNSTDSLFDTSVTLETPFAAMPRARFSTHYEDHKNNGTKYEEADFDEYDNSEIVSDPIQMRFDLKVNLDVSSFKEIISFESEVKGDNKGFNTFISILTPINGYNVMRLDVFSTWNPLFKAGVVYKQNYQQLFQFNIDVLPSEEDLKLIILMKTPFKGFQNIQLNASQTIGPQYQGYKILYLDSITYIQDDLKFQLKANYDLYDEPDYEYDREFSNITSNNEGVHKEVIKVNLEGSINDQKITTDLSMMTQDSSTGYKFNFSVVTETPFDLIRRVNISANYQEELKNGIRDDNWKVTAEYNDFESSAQLTYDGKKINFNASASKDGTILESEIEFNRERADAIININTPFEDFENIRFNLKANYDLYDEPDYEYDREFSNITSNNEGVHKEVIKVNLEGSINDQKITTDLSMMTQDSSTGYKFNFSVVTETSFDFMRHATLFTLYEEEYSPASGHLYQHGEGLVKYNEFGVALKFKLGEAAGQPAIDSFEAESNGDEEFMRKENPAESFTLSVEGSFNDQKITADLSISMGTDFSIVIQTPFEGFNKLNLNGSLITEPYYSARLSYDQDDYRIQLKGEYKDENSRNTFRNYTSDYDYEYGMNNSTISSYENEEGNIGTSIFYLEGIFNDQKMATNASLTTEYSATGYKFDASVDVETPFDFFRHGKLSTQYKTDDIEGYSKQLLETSVEYNELVFKTNFNASLYQGLLPAMNNTDYARPIYVSTMVETPFNIKLALDASMLTNFQSNKSSMISILNTSGEYQDHKGSFKIEQERITVGYETEIHEEQTKLSVIGKLNDQVVSGSCQYTSKFTQVIAESLDVTITTPFEGYKLLNLHASTTANYFDTYETTITYDHNGYLMGLEGKYHQMYEEKGMPINVNFEGYVNDQIMVIEFETKQVQVPSLYIADAPNFSIKVTTPFEGFEELSLKSSFAEGLDHLHVLHVLTASLNKQKVEIESKYDIDNSERNSSMLQSKFNDIVYSIRADYSIQAVTPFEAYENISFKSIYVEDVDKFELANKSHKFEVALSDQLMAIIFNTSEPATDIWNFAIKVITPLEGYEELSLKSNLQRKISNDSMMTDFERYEELSLKSNLQGNISNHSMMTDFEVDETVTSNKIGYFYELVAVVNNEISAIELNVDDMESEVPNFSLNLATPFEGYKELNLRSNFAQNAPNYDILYKFDAAIQDQKIAIGLDITEIELEVPSVFIKVTTPFEGYEEVSLKSVYAAQKTRNSTEDDMSFEEYDNLNSVIDDTNSISYTLAATLNDREIAISFNVSDLQLDIPNFSIDIITPFEGFNELGLKSNFAHMYRESENLNDDYSFSYMLDFSVPTYPSNMTLVVQFSGFNSSLAIETPFDGFEKMFINSTLSADGFEVNADLSHDQQYYLSTQYSEEPFYSFNGTAHTPFSIIDDFTWTTYAQFDDTSAIFASLNWVEMGNITFSATHEEYKFETGLTTPFDLLRSAKLSTRLEIDFDSEDDILLLVSDAEFNEHKGSIQLKFVDQEDRFMKLSAVGSLDDQLMELVFQITEESGEFGVVLSGSAMGETANITGTFTETQESLIMTVTASVMDYTAMLNSSLTEAGTKSLYAVAFDMDLPIDDWISNNTTLIQLRGQVTIDDWDRVNAGASAAVPLGYYSIDGSYVLDDSSLTLNGSVLSPSLNLSLKAGGSYESTQDHVKGEIYIWENKVYASYNDHDENLNGELGVVLPDAGFDPAIFKLEILDELSQLNVSATVGDELHSLTIISQYEESDVDFKATLNSSFFGSEKSVSVNCHFEEAFADLKSVLTDGDISHVIEVEISNNSTNSEDYSATLKIDSPAFEPIFADAKVSQTNEGVELSLNVKYCEDTHSISGKYHQIPISADMLEAYSTIINVTSPFLHERTLTLGGSVEIIRIPSKIVVFTELDVFGEYLLEAKFDSTEFDFNSKLLSYLKLKFGSFKLDTRLSFTYEFDNLKTVVSSLDIEDSSLRPSRFTTKYVYNETDLEFEMSTLEPNFSFELHNNFNETSSSYDTSAILRTPFRFAKDLGFVVKIPYYHANKDSESSDPQEYHTELLLMLLLPNKLQYSLSADLQVKSAESRLQSRIELILPGTKWGTSLSLNGNDMYQLKFTVDTPIVGFKHHSFDMKIQMNEGILAETKILLDWRDDRIEFISSIQNQIEYVFEIGLKTPFAGLERHGLSLRWVPSEHERFGFKALLEGPRNHFGTEIHFEFNSATDFIGKASIFTPFVGYESSTIQLSNRLNENSFSAHAEAVLFHQGVSAAINATKGNNEFGIKSHINFNSDNFMNFETSGHINENSLQSVLKLNIPILSLFTSNSTESLFNIDSFLTIDAFIRLDNNPTLENTGFGLKINDDQIFLISYDNQQDGIKILSFLNPWQPMRLMVASEYSPSLINYQIEFCWDTNHKNIRWAEGSATIGAQLLLRNTVSRQQYRIRFILPGRSLNAEYNLESTEKTMDHSVEVYFPGTVGYSSVPNHDTIGYHIKTEKTDGSRSILLRLGFLYYFCEIESEQSSTSSHSLTWAELRSDVWRPGYDVSAMGFRHESNIVPRTYSQKKEERNNRLVLYQATEKNQDSYHIDSEIILDSKFKFSNDIYGTILDETEIARHLNISVRNPDSTTDLNLIVNLTSTSDMINLNARMEDRFNTSRFLDLVTDIKTAQKKIDIQMRTAMNSIIMSGNVTRPTDFYQFNWNTVLNDVDASSFVAHFNPNRPELLIESLSSGTEFNLYAGMPSDREVLLRSTRNMYGRTINDGQFNLKLNTTSLLSSRLYWRADSVIELRNHGINFLTDVLATGHSITDSAMEMLVDSNPLPSIWNASVIKKMIERTQMDVMKIVTKIPIQAILNPIKRSYVRNDFYIRTFVNALQRVTEPLRIAVNALMNEGFAIYGGFNHVLEYVVYTTSSPINEITLFFERAFGNLSAKYDQLVGEILNPLFTLETQFYNIVRNPGSFVNQYAGRLEEIIMMKIEELRQKAIQWFSLYLDQLRPYFEQFDSYMSDFRQHVLASFQETYETVREHAMEYPLVKAIVSFYSEYASWFEEMHASDYIDEINNYIDQIQMNLMHEWRVMTAPYRPTIDAFVMAFDGQMEAFKQLPVVLYITSAAEHVTQEVKEFYKFAQLEVQLRDILRRVLRHTDHLTQQLLHDLKETIGFETLPWRPTIVYDSEAGRLEWTQRLPFNWDSFFEMPYLPDLYSKLFTTRSNFLRTFDYSPFYYDVMDTFATLPTLNIRTILPPFGSHATVAGTQHFITFDQRYYEFSGECSYLLVSDFFHQNFSVAANYEGNGGRVTRKSLSILSNGRQIEVDADFRITLDSKKIEMPLIYEQTSIMRDGQRIIITNDNGYSVNCNLLSDVCTVHVSGWSFGKTGGLFGIYNNEPSDDFTTPNRSQNSDTQIAEFANSWNVGTSRCSAQNFAVTNPNPSSRAQQICEDMFAKNDSVLRPCFRLVDPKPYKTMCINDMSDLQTTATEESGVCTAAAAYVTECQLAGLDILVPAQCVRCELENGQTIASGETKNFNNDAPNSADIVLIVDYKSCLKDISLSSLPTVIDSALNGANISQNRFAVVGYGGKGIFNKPHTRTAKGQIWSNSLNLQNTLKDLPLNDDGVSGDIFSALRYAVDMSYRAGVSKQFILISCSNDCQASSYADALTLLIENDIKLHLLQPLDLIVKGKSSFQEDKNVYGFDADEVFTIRNVRNLQGDRELRRQLVLPKDFCTPLALETNGTLFDLEKMVSSQSTEIKQFVDIFAHRVAATAQPSPCQRCDCIGDRDGNGTILCQRCVSPILERLEKIWEKLVHENLLEDLSTSANTPSLPST